MNENSTNLSVEKLEEEHSVDRSNSSRAKEEIKSRKLSILDEKSQKNLSIKAYFLYFASTTTAHGFLRVANTQSRNVRILWILFMMLALSGLIFHFTQLLLSHLAYEVQTEMINEATEFQMPVIFVCQEAPYANRFKVEKPLFDNFTISALFTQLNQFWSFTNLTSRIRAKSRLSAAPYLQQYNGILEYQDWTFFCKFNTKYDCELQTFLDEEMHQCLQMDLTNESSTTLFSDKGIWFAFITSPVLSPGELYNDPQELLSFTTPTVTFNERGEYPNFKLNRIQAYRQHLTYANLNIRVQEEFSFRNSCLKQTENLTILGHNNQPVSYKYTMHLCNLIRHQQLIMDKCNCYSEKLPIPYSNSKQFSIQNLYFCHKLSVNMLNLLSSKVLNSTSILNHQESVKLISQSKCHDRYFDEFIQTSTDCKQKCTSTMYSWMNINYNNWPPVEYLSNKDAYGTVNKNIEYLTAKYNVTRTQLTIDSFPPSYLGSLKILPRKPMGLKIIEREAYPISNFLSSIGSILGLWVGISLISIVEILELLLSVTYYACKSYCKKRR